MEDRGSGGQGSSRSLGQGCSGLQCIWWRLSPLWWCSPGTPCRCSCTWRAPVGWRWIQAQQGGWMVQYCLSTFSEDKYEYQFDKTSSSSLLPVTGGVSLPSSKWFLTINIQNASLPSKVWCSSSDPVTKNNSTSKYNHLKKKSINYEP